MMEQRVPGTVRLALHCNCDFYKEKGCWRYNQKFCVETEMSTDTSLSDLNLRLMDTIAPVAGHKGKITSVSSRLPGKRFNGNPVHLKKIETEDDLEYLLQICKNSFVVNKDIYRVDVFVKFEPLNIEEEYGKDVAQFLAKLKNDKAYEAEVLAGLEELNQEEWEDDIFQMDEDIALEQLAANASEACNASSEFPYGSGLSVGDTGAISLDKIGAYRPISATNTCQDEDIVVAQEDIQCAGGEEKVTVADSVSDESDGVPDIAVCEKSGTPQHHAPEKGGIAADIVSVKAAIVTCNAPEKKQPLMGLSKKVKRSRRALSKFFGLFTCFATPSCLA
ncbi:hypothetical protein M9435_006613 [Picochlorum sp. BPE23]|nr:hypothetical protein M9435_006613 [Picochlorum sp. BPE23]